VPRVSARRRFFSQRCGEGSLSGAAVEVESVVFACVRKQVRPDAIKPSSRHEAARKRTVCYYKFVKAARGVRPRLGLL